MIRKSAALIAVLTCMALALCGCGGGSGTNSSPTGPTSATSDPVGYAVSFMGKGFIDVGIKNLRNDRLTGYRLLARVRDDKESRVDIPQTGVRRITSYGAYIQFDPASLPVGIKMPLTLLDPNGTEIPIAIDDGLDTPATFIWVRYN